MKLNELPVEEQVNLYKIQSGITGKYFCFQKESPQDYYNYQKEHGKELLNPFTQTPINDQGLLQELETKRSSTSSSSYITKTMGVVTCKELLSTLEKSNMTNNEKIIFMTQNRASSKALQSFIEKQHFNLEDAKYFANMGSLVMKVIQKHVKDISDMLFDQPFDESDPDCKYLKDLLQQLSKEREKTEKPLSSNRLLDKVKQGVKQVAETSWKGIKTVGGYAYNLAVFAVQYMSKSAFEIWQWIPRDPKTAFFALLYLKGLRNKLCRMAGDLVGYFGPSTSREFMLKQLAKQYPDLNVSPTSSVEDMKEIIKEASQQIITDISMKSMGTVVG